MTKILFLTILLFAHLPAFCNELAGTLSVPEDYDCSNGRELSLYYEWYQEVDKDKPIIVFLNGGPGVSYQWYISQHQLFSNLSQRFNLFFYDTRGVGRSSALKKSNLSKRDLNRYGMKEHAKDLERLQKEIIREDKIILFGHSFGGLTAYNYALEYPENVSAVISANMASSLTGLMEGSYHFQSIYRELMEQIGRTKMFQLQMKDMVGMLMYPGIGAISFSDLLVVLNSVVYSKDGRKNFLNLFNEIYDYNFDLDKFNQLKTTEYKKSLPILKNREILDSFSREHNLLLSITSYTHYLSDKVFSELTSDAIKEFFLEEKESRPELFSSLHTVELDVAGKIQEIESPILIIAGKYDPMVLIEWIRKDVTRLRSFGKDVTFIEMETGHNPYIEESEEFVRVINRFLRYF